MTLSIPYTFTAGTTAKSQEVNANFEAVQTEVNTIDIEVATTQTDIVTLQNGKASVNGSASNTFSVADPVNASDAVNKRYFSYINGYIIAGLTLSKADEEYISCSAGACYDETVSKILRFTEDVSKSEYPYNLEATYYVYIIGTSAGGTNTQLIISQSSSNPGLPSGYTLYRGLGYFTTNDLGEIDKVVPYSMMTGKDLNKYIKSVVIEEYTSGTSGYRIYSDGYCEQWGVASLSGSGVTTNLLKTFANTNYNIVFGVIGPMIEKNHPSISSIRASSFVTVGDGRYNIRWKASGDLA